jgi:hypothetical protein
MPKCQYSFFSYTRFSLQVILTSVGYPCWHWDLVCLSWLKSSSGAVKETVLKASFLNQAHHLL